MGRSVISIAAAIAAVLVAPAAAQEKIVWNHNVWASSNRKRA